MIGTPGLYITSLMGCNYELPLHFYFLIDKSIYLTPFKSMSFIFAYLHNTPNKPIIQNLNPLPLLHPPTNLHQLLRRPLKIRHLKINLPTQPHPPPPAINHTRNKRLIIRNQRLTNPIPHRTRHILLLDPLLYTNRSKSSLVKRQPHINHTTPRQRLRCIIQHLRPQRLGNYIPALARKPAGVRSDSVFAADARAPGERRGDAQVRRVVDGAYKLEVCDEGGFGDGVFGQRVGDAGGGGDEWLEAVGGGEGGADEWLVFKGDVEEGAAAGGVEPSLEGC